MTSKPTGIFPQNPICASCYDGTHICRGEPCECPICKFNHEGAQPEGWGLTREQIRKWAASRGDDAGRLSRFVLRLLADCARLRAELDVARADAERERMRLAGCSVAALGYYKRGDAIAPEYGSGSLDDVIALRERAEAAEANAARLRKALREQAQWPGTSHYAHYDPTGGAGGGCPACHADADRRRAAALAADGDGRGKVEPS